MSLDCQRVKTLLAVYVGYKLGPGIVATIFVIAITLLLLIATLVVVLGGILSRAYQPMV